MITAFKCLLSVPVVTFSIFLVTGFFAMSADPKPHGFLDTTAVYCMRVTMVFVALVVLAGGLFAVWGKS